MRKTRRERHLHLSSCGVTRVEWGQTSVELYEPQELSQHGATAVTLAALDGVRMPAMLIKRDFN